MSGGSMDYVCYKVAEASTMTHDPEFAELLRDKKVQGLYQGASE